MLSVFIDELGGEYSEYIEGTIELILPMVNFSTNDEIRNVVAKCLPKLLKCFKESNKENKDIILGNLAKEFNKVLWTAINTEFEPSVIIN